jgi:hypothetical protein
MSMTNDEQAYYMNGYDGDNSYNEYEEWLYYQYDQRQWLLKRLAFTLLKLADYEADSTTPQRNLDITRVRVSLLTHALSQG